MTPSTLERQVETALSAETARKMVRDAAKEALESGVPRDEVYARLEALRARFQDEGRDEAEEVVMDVMDLFEGHAHPRNLL
jgi:hypothetical protein